MELERKIREISGILRELFYDEPVIALAGAHAKGAADSDSDIDIFLFGYRPKPYEKRKKVIEEFSDNPTECFVSEHFDYPWGGSVDFPYQGTPVEVVVRLIPETEKILSRCAEGEFEIIPQNWTSNGYYTFVYLSEIRFLKPLQDPEGWLEQNKRKLETYPEKLKQSIFSTFLKRAGTWIDNFHYASAVKRQDTLFTAPIVLHTLLDLIQVIFAVNEVYFNGDKKLEKTLAELPYCPEKLLKNLDFLLKTEKEQAVLEAQAALLKELYLEVREAAEKGIPCAPTAEQ